MRLQNQRQDTRTLEALQSPKWSADKAASHTLPWLKRQPDAGVDESMSVKEAVGVLLHRMVLDREFAKSLCAMLERWKTWAENGGMQRADLAALKESQVEFAYATLLVAMINRTAVGREGSEGGTLSMDLQECLKLWRMVRLG